MVVGKPLLVIKTLLILIWNQEEKNVQIHVILHQGPLSMRDVNDIKRHII